MRSKLQAFVSDCLIEHLAGCEIIEDSWPDWLKMLTGRRLQLDFYLPEMQVAIEVQGVQHYEMTPHFHSTPSDFDEIKKRDELKRQACAYQKVQLLTIDDSTDVLAVVRQLHSLWRNRPKAKPTRRKAGRRYAILASDSSRRFLVRRHFFEEMIALKRARKLDDHLAIANPDYTIQRVRPGANPVFRRQIIDVEEKSPPSQTQAERPRKSFFPEAWRAFLCSDRESPHPPIASEVA